MVKINCCHKGAANVPATVNFVISITPIYNSLDTSDSHVQLCIHIICWVATQFCSMHTLPHP